MYFHQPLFRLILIAALWNLAPQNTLAQSPQSVVTPWSVDNTTSQSQIRQYHTFRTLQNNHVQQPQTEESYKYTHRQNLAALKNRATLSQNSLPSENQNQSSSSQWPEPQIPSALENMYSGRIVDELDQYGYDMFASANDKAITQTNTPAGAVQDDFILNSGDDVNVFFTGQRTDRDTYTINSSGQLLMPDIPPISAAGRTISQVHEDLEAAALAFHNTKAYISLASVRQIGVLVVGHAKKPGRQNLTVFNTVLDALMAAGGIDKTGSMRQIKLVRNGRSMFIDLYALLLHGSTNIDMQLRDGDRIIIPAIGPTVAISGEVKRPAIYEILPSMRGMRHEPENSSEHLTLNDMLALGGGVLAPGKNRFIKLGLNADGQEIAENITDPFTPTFGDGAILTVSKGTAKREGTIELVGNTNRPGMHAIQSNKTLSTLLPSSDLLGDNIYPLIGVIERQDKNQLTRKLLNFPLRLVLNGQYDRKLEDGDIVHLFSTNDIAALDQNTIMPDVGSSDPNVEPSLLQSDETLRSYLQERSVFIRGAVRNEGHYPVSEGVTLDSIIAVAGGLALEADRSNIELTSASEGASKHRTRINLGETNPADIIVNAGDSVRVNQKFNKIVDNSVLIMGEVHNPGRYDLVAGDKISDLLERAGGLTDQSYAYGAIFSRDAERRAEESRFRAQAQSIKLGIATAIESDEKKIDAGKIAEARALASELETAQGVGRITVEADPAALSVNPELDLLLERGDRLFIPKRGLTVRVHGEVLSPASLQFRENKKSLDYVHEAGGFTFHADKDRTFVIYPDGSAQPLQVSSWNYNPVMIPPGSTIVVPRDPKPFDFIESAKDVSQILSNLAVTAIFIDDVADN